MIVIPVEGSLLKHVVDATYPIWYDGLDKPALGRVYAAQMKTAWGRGHQQRFALVECGDLLASAEQYDLAGTLDGRAVRICGLGSVLTGPAQRGRGHARLLIETLVARARREGAGMALLFPDDELEQDACEGFDVLPLTEVTLGVAETPRPGAPMTMVRIAEAREFAAIAAMGQVRAAPFRFHLDRDADFIQYVVTRKRLLAGVGAAGARELHFFIAEEGITAAVYVVVSVAGENWTLEECGDRDVSGARVGALLQALVAREPAERRPTIRGCLPPGVLPPQITVAAVTAPAATVMTRVLTETAAPQLAREDVLYWFGDIL